MSESESDSTCSCKVGRIAARYDLADLDGELARYWTGEGDERYSTRRLARYVNESILEAAFDRTGVRYKDGEIENTYRLLTDDDVSSGERVQTRNELERESIPVDRLESDFVSHQTVYNHLTKCLELSLEQPSDEERLERGRNRLRALQARTATVTEETVDRLRRTDVLDLGEHSVLVSITVTCEECHEQLTLREVFERGGCECGGETPT
ncbi:rod-determining factor RdfA [Natrialbaceae archaeon GCM10025810]|uniref:rod-determining factor RdfA n=1 Tax=Halovalidus salilacus TaxID=3075124 RepID=UPI0036074321